MKQLRVVHGPVNVGNQPWELSRSERKLGIQSDVIVNYSTWFGYPADRCLSAYGKRTYRSVIDRMKFALTSPFRYDVLHYYFGRSFMTWEDYSADKPWWFSDLKLAKHLGRKVFMTLQGCDIRQSDLSAERNEISMCREGNCGVVPTCRTMLDARRRYLGQRILPLVDRVFVLNPELAHFAPNSQFMPYSNVNIHEFKPTYPNPADDKITILHAPSDEKIKGTRYILEAVERLKQRYPIELVLVKSLPHAEAMKLYHRADLVIDQLLAGWYGGLAVEVMAMGKPVACYIRDADMKFVPPAMLRQLPIVRLTPETVEHDLEQALRRRHEWNRWGRETRNYVVQWHDPRKIAAAMIRAYRDPQSRFELHTEELPACAA